MIEKQFMGPAVDQPGAFALRVLLARDDSKLTTEVCVGWTRFLMSLRLRNPHMVAEVRKEGTSQLTASLLVNPEEYEAVRSQTDPPTLLEFAQTRAPAFLENAGILLLPGLIDDEKIGQAIFQMRWWVVELRGSGYDLLTSDNPYFMSHGLGDERCLVALPLGPRFVFFATRHESRVDQVMSTGAKAVIFSLNDAMVTQARRHVYGASNRQKRFVENRLTRTLDPV